jgi:hypothetical protein
MQALEKRQARRIKRHAKEAERSIFELIEMMGGDGDDALDWEGAIRLIENARIELQLVFDLAAAAQKEIQ